MIKIWQNLKKKILVERLLTSSLPSHVRVSLSPSLHLVPVNLKTTDSFHLSLEEYLLALVDVVDELSRLAMNAVTLGDARTVTVTISSFVKDVYSGFQLLNLKNDVVRRRFDGMKYSVKKVEEVIYDLSLRSIIGRGCGGDGGSQKKQGTEAEAVAPEGKGGGGAGDVAEGMMGMDQHGMQTGEQGTGLGGA